MKQEIGRVVFRFQGGSVEVVLDGGGNWVAPPRLRDFLSLSCGRERNPVSEPWGWGQLNRAADLLGGTAIPLRGGDVDPRACDAQVPTEVVEFAGGSLMIPEGAVRIDAPDQTQDDDYSCGAVLLESFARYFDVAPDDQTTDVREWFKRKLGTTKADGTPPPRMFALAKALGLNPDVAHPMSDDELRTRIDAGRPVVCCVQAWGDPKGYAAAEYGHYVGAIGYDDEHVYFEDPVLRRARGYMGWRQFAERWHDKDGDGNLYRRWGMSLWRPDDAAKPIE